MAKRPSKKKGKDGSVGLFDAEVELCLPPRTEVAAKVHRNSIRKLAFNGDARKFRLSAFEKGKTVGVVATDRTGRTTFITNKPTNATVPADDVLLLPEANEFSASEIQRAIATNKHRWLQPKPLEIQNEMAGESEERCRQVTASWESQFEFQQERDDAKGNIIPGLRAPQIGALHAGLAHWSVTHKAATVVMPTGTGKTETMLALLTCARLSRLLVVVPNNALREQIVEKFETLGVLQASGCLAHGASLPVVCSLLHRPQSVTEVDDVFLRCNVIVSTMQVVGQCGEDVQRRMAELCSHLFIDEAHHIAARTWTEFKNRFDEKHIVQFTATPFRTDGKRVDGKFIYTYPLSKAQAEGYFRKITFIPVAEYDDQESDNAIARKAVERLDTDLKAGHDHVLMARVDSINRADEVLAIYKKIAAKQNPVAIHSKTPAAQRKKLLEDLRARKSRIVVCVDMFGEGFDFPELKVAALHDRHKSLAITLQFIGRFTRSKSNIGDASIVANIADDAISNALRNLYAEDADWNFLLRMLSEGATDRARKRHELFEGFTDALPEIPLQTLYPKMSAVVYRTACEEWEPLKIQDIIPGAQLYAGPVINPEHRLAIFVTRDEIPVRWGAVKQIQDIEWNLYVIHWDEKRNLLFINSSNKDFHEKIAEAVTGSQDRVTGESVFRILGRIKRLTLTNLGLSHAFGKNIRYTMFMGTNIAEGLSEAGRANRRKSNLFGLGFEDDEKVTVGCSFKGRFWSYKVAFDLSDWIEWCHHIGTKLLDTSIDTNAIFDHVIKAKEITERPPLVPIMVSWPEGFSEQLEDQVELELGGTSFPFFECETEITNYSDSGPLSFAVVSGGKTAVFEILMSEAEGAIFKQTSGTTAYAKVRNNKKSLADWFNQDPPIIHFANGDFLVFNELFELPRDAQRQVFDSKKILVWDWSGVDIKKESQGDAKDPASIQRRVIDKVLKGEFGDTNIVFDDDGSGEIADVVSITQGGNKTIVRLFHCKYSKEDQAGKRINDFYEVCGQAQKCVRWREDPRKLLKHMLHREALRTKANKPSRFEKGDAAQVKRLQNTAKELAFEYQVYIVQPGLSKVQLSSAHGDLLAATEGYLLETYSMPLRVIASK